MILILESPLEVMKIDGEKNQLQWLIRPGTYQIKRVSDPTGKSQRPWFVLTDSPVEIVGAPEGYFRQFAQARGQYRVMIKEEENG